LILDMASRTCHCSGRTLDLSRREIDLLELLLRQAGAVVRRDSLENALYSFNEPVTPNAVEATVSRLRRKLGDNPEQPERIKTVRGRGYLFSRSAWG